MDTVRRTGAEKTIRLNTPGCSAWYSSVALPTVLQMGQRVGQRATSAARLFQPSGPKQLVLAWEPLRGLRNPASQLRASRSAPVGGFSTGVDYPQGVVPRQPRSP